MASVLVGIVSAPPAYAAVTTAAAPSQVLSSAVLVGQATPAAGPTTLSDGNGLALTDDPAVIRAAASLGQAAPSEFARNAATAPASSSANESGDSSEGAARSVKGLNAHDLLVTHGFAVEPPDQGLCANSDFTVEMTNLNIKVFDARLNAVSGPIVLETFFNEPANGSLIQGDPRCVWDAGTHRWFLSQLVVDLVNGTSKFQVAASTSSNPLGSFNLYTLDNTDHANPGCAPTSTTPGGCLGDQPTMGVDSHALFIDTNEFGIFNNEFNGAVIYTIDKRALAAGASTANVVADFVGLTVPTPEWNSTTSCLGPQEGLYCWATIRPATSPTYDTRFGGTEYFLSALDFANVQDHRIAVWAMTGTSSISSSTPNLHLFHKVMNSESYVFPSHLVAQKDGPIPLGQSGRYSCDVPGSCALIGGTKTPQAEGAIQPNDDQFGSAVFADGLVWGGLTTALSDNRTAIAYFAVKPRLTSSGLGGSSIELQDYLTARGNSLLFPSIAVTAEGQGLINFTLVGQSYFPTSAYALLDREGAGKVKIAALGQSPQDGFSEYECRNAQPGGLCNQFGVPYRPRWGDYSAAVAVGDRFVFSSEYIQFPNCSLAEFTQGNIDNSKLDHTCGGTRQRAANWGTSVNTLSVGEEEKD